MPFKLETYRFIKNEIELFEINNMLLVYTTNVSKDSEKPYWWAWPANEMDPINGYHAEADNRQGALEQVARTFGNEE